MNRHRRHGLRYPDERMRLILAEIKKDDRALDVGCVNKDLDYTLDKGCWLHWLLVEKAAYVLGIDIVEPAVKRLQEMGYSVMVADVETMQLHQTFDVIVAGELIEHLSNPGLFLDRAHKHLNDGGKLIVTTPNPWNFIFMVTALYRDAPINEDHTCWFDPVTLRQLLGRHGFTVDKLELVRPVGARGWRISHLLCNLGLKRIGACGMVVVASNAGLRLDS